MCVYIYIFTTRCLNLKPEGLQPSAASSASASTTSASPSHPCWPGRTVFPSSWAPLLKGLGSLLTGL